MPQKVYISRRDASFGRKSARMSQWSCVLFDIFKKTFERLPLFIFGFSILEKCINFAGNSSQKKKGLLNYKTMYIEVVKSKLHRVTVTEANLNYIGSVTIDEDLMDAANLIEGEKVQIVNNNNGERLETYVIKGVRGSGMICLNGAAARKVQPGDIIIIMAYAWMNAEEAKIFKPAIVFPDTKTNKLI